ncbi:MAG: sodium:solute symporter family protein [Verrucomicrobiae bacterium]|nr:sodium:solute symporter family protein [Verrucomicrobiae bacterium]
MASTTFGFTWLDGMVVLVYFVGITGFGLWISRKTKSSSGYFLGERKLPWWVMLGQAFGTGTHAENPVAQAGVTCQLGFATIWYQWKNLLITPFYWLIAPWYRRSECTTVSEMIEQRYGRFLSVVYSVFALAFLIFCQGCMLKGAAKVISVASGGTAISPNMVVAGMTVVFIIYSFFGGLKASAYTDFVQSFLIIVLSFMLIPLGLKMVGGFSGMHQCLPADFFDLYNEKSGVDLFTILMLALNGLVGMSAQPHAISMNATGITERAGRIGQTYGAMVKRFCAIGWGLTGLLTAAMLIQSGKTLADHEMAFGYACRKLLGPGWMGLMVACMLAANMSTCSNLMINAGALFTRDFYKVFLKPRATDRELLVAGRISGLLFTGMGIVYALAVEQVLDAFLFTETISALFGIMFIGGILWRRANRQGAMAATAGACVSFYFSNYLLTCLTSGPADNGSKGLWTAFGRMFDAVANGQACEFLASGKHQLIYPWMAGPFGFSMLTGFLFLIVVSLLTKPESAERTGRFFDKMNHSTDNDQLFDGIKSPSAGECGEDLIFLDLPGWLTAKRWKGFWKRYREDLLGFVIAWAAIGFIIWMAWLIMQIGGAKC